MGETTDSSIDLAKLEDISGNDPVFIASILRSIIDTLPAQLTAIKTACTAGEWPEVARTAHQTVSTTTYVGSAELQALLKSIERDAGEPSPGSQMKSLVERLETLGGVVLRDLQIAVARLGSH